MTKENSCVRTVLYSFPLFYRTISHRIEFRDESETPETPTSDIIWRIRARFETRVGNQTFNANSRGWARAQTPRIFKWFAGQYWCVCLCARKFIVTICANHRVKDDVLRRPYGVWANWTRGLNWFEMRTNYQKQRPSHNTTQQTHTQYAHQHRSS